MAKKYDEFFSVSLSILTRKEQDEVYSYIKKVVESNYWQDQIANILHHEKETIAVHSIKVCCYSYKIAKNLKKRFPSINYSDLCIGAICHDMFGYNWQKKKEFFKFNFLHPIKSLASLHGFSHPAISYMNLKKYFPSLVNKKIKDIITKHMWPLTPIFPRYIESYIVTYADKKVSVYMLKKISNWKKFIGIKKSLNSEN